MEAALDLGRISWAVWNAEILTFVTYIGFPYVWEAVW